ncbi:MAG: Hsp20/alpha crystallin family protein [Paracoccaceae bacterium]|nr:Hsp20/alpha crystallin family protein [Paracoccaceae bacterium]MDE3123486.1 Hsp20/alpha crystallin family protein [Paracoccaceae bacterium]MDE3237520.1 Hsp20/alpha crystallin family protein [Paracoccaceae bacterium]
MVEKTHASGFWPSLYEPFRTIGNRVADWFAPASEASSNDTAYAIAIELPGVAEEDIQMTLDDGVVTVSGEKRTAREEEGESWYFSERQFGSFSRSFRLPPDADEAGVAATLKDGVLTITVPKRAASAAEGARTISIRRG